MADPTTGAGEGAERGPVVRDRRKIDPETGRVREAYAAHSGPVPEDSPARADGEGAASVGGARASADSVNGRSDFAVEPGTATAEAAVDSGGTDPRSVAGAEHMRDVDVESILADQLSADLAAARSAAEERLADLQRLQAEYVNYRRRVDRDRDVARDLAVAGVLEALLPVLDDVHLARQHGDLESGPFSAIAEKLEAILARLGLSRYGEPGETFDPTVHEALMHLQAELAEGTTEPTVVQVLQPGYRIGERVLRAARVAVADPQ
jgi:molecular chaperone GrpE